MSDKHQDSPVPAAGISREEAQRRIEEILAREEQAGQPAAKRTRRILVIVLVVLLLLLCGVSVFLYRLLVPEQSGGAGGDDLSDTNGIIWVRSIYGYGSEANELFTNPNDAATGPDGIVWVTDPGNQRVIGFRADGTMVDIIEGNKETGEPFRLPSRLAVDPEGVLYLVDRANETLTLMDGQTKLVSSSIPGIMSVDSDDEITVVGSEAGFAILDKEGNVQTIVGTRGQGEDQFDQVGGVSIDSETRTIYVVDTYNNRLSAWDYEGVQKWITQLGNPGNKVKLEGGSSLETTSVAEAGLQVPTDVTVDGRGRPLVLDAFDFTISAFDPQTGEYIDKWGTYGDQDGKFMYPSGFDYDATKDWFTVADTQNLRAQIVRIEGTSEGGAAAVRTGLSRLLAGPLRALWPCLTLLPLLLLVLAVNRWRKRRREQSPMLARHENVTNDHFVQSSETSVEDGLD